MPGREVLLYKHFLRSSHMPPPSTKPLFDTTCPPSANNLGARGDVDTTPRLCISRRLAAATTRQLYTYASEYRIACTTRPSRTSRSSAPPSPQQQHCNKHRNRSAATELPMKEKTERQHSSSSLPNRPPCIPTDLPSAICRRTRSTYRKTPACTRSALHATAIRECASLP